MQLFADVSISGVMVFQFELVHLPKEVEYGVKVCLARIKSTFKMNNIQRGPARACQINQRMIKDAIANIAPENSPSF
jgi:hypothetical protein